MYRLYFLPGACSLAIHTLLHELEQPVELINKNALSDFSALNPLGAVPVLVDGSTVLREGAALMLYLLDKHPNNWLPVSGLPRARAIENIMFANATVHPAYSKLFFLKGSISDEAARAEGFQAAVASLNKLWCLVDSQLAEQLYLGGSSPSPADLLLTVYAGWNAYFQLPIQLGSNVERMIAAVRARPAFQRALAAEQAQA